MSVSTKRKPVDIEHLMIDGKLIDKALERGRIEALRRHAAAGVPIVIWEDGRIKKVPAEPLLKEALRNEKKRNGKAHTKSSGKKR